MLILVFRHLQQRGIQCSVKHVQSIDLFTICTVHKDKHSVYTVLTNKHKNNLNTLTNTIIVYYSSYDACVQYIKTICMHIHT